MISNPQIDQVAMQFQLRAQTSFELLTSSGRPLTVLCFDDVPYPQSHKAMLDYASQRTEQDPDQIWLLQHPKVYTQGTACNLLTLGPSDIPVLKTDRGGQITYHGPGQIVMYPLLHLKWHGLGVKTLVKTLEQCVIDVLVEHGLSGERREDAPGVYVNDAKIAALGLRIKRGNSYHGLSVNVDMDLTPFNNINPCGYEGLKVTQLAEYHQNLSVTEVGEKLAIKFASLI